MLRLCPNIRFMATMKIKDAEKAVLQHELKFYTNLLENHEKKMLMKNASAKASVPDLNGTVTRNARISTQNFLTVPTNYVSSNKPTKCLNVALTNTMHKRFIGCNTILKKQKVSDIKSKATFHESTVLQNRLKRYPYNYNSGMSNKYTSKPVNNIKTSLQNNMLTKKNNVDLQKKPNPIFKCNPPVLTSQALVDEIKILTEQLKQKSKNILPSKKADYVMINSSTKNQLNFQSNAKISVQHEHKVYKKTSPFKKNSNVNILHANMDILLNGEANISKSVSVALKLSANSNLSLNKNINESCKINLSDSTSNPSMKPKPIVENKSVEALSKPDLKMSLNSVNNIKKSSKPLHGNTHLKTPVKTKLIKKHNNSIKKVGNRTKLISSKYKIINKKSPCVQIATSGKPVLKSLKNTSKFNKLSNSNRKWTSTKLKVNTSTPIAETSKLNSKYKVVNKSDIVPESCINKNSALKKKKLSVVSSYPNASRILNYSGNTSVIKKVCTPTKPNYGGINKNISLSRLKSGAVRSSLKKSAIYLTPKKTHSQSSKYKVVNKTSSSVNKISKGAIINSNKLSDFHNISMDLDLLLELAAEKNKSVNNDELILSPRKHVLTKRIYKSKNAIVNRNAQSAQYKAVKMIKTKYSILNKHSWQRQTALKKFVSSKFYKGNRLNASFQRKMSTSPYHRKNKRHFSKYKTGVRNPSYFVQKSCRRRYLASKDKIYSGSFRSPKAYKRNTKYQKISLKTPSKSKLTVPISKSLASRVLNRSINRVLTASKKASKTNRYCMFYNRFGRCNKGVKCPFVHDPKKIAVCTRFLRGTCKTENCPFSHEICPGKMAICSFFLLGSCTKTDCPYRHETLAPDAKLCKAFVQGYCPEGKECKKAHILVCPQFIQGNCKKGDTCAFPHPPSKERKNVSKTVEKNENPKAIEKDEDPKEIEDVLLEKMSRYFEPLCEQVNVDKSNNSVVVPRIQSLPEQPAYIAFSN
ncbi:zinc finger CCCH domain-containing protein 3 [Trichonephila inaurata madagascariensis]|uniref:Zinc finger CCCH domain-containing protein 3 n=1 Tax=Trichonephila inaurata madagascariensis TaxID=2747483 RepID=A0A8X6YGL4_9ARAC|nr:zinc finger CCCH domain-containing protein 3 [Trichonephila inaurata madagascariensis]